MVRFVVEIFDDRSLLGKGVAVYGCDKPAWGIFVQDSINEGPGWVKE